MPIQHGQFNEEPSVTEMLVDPIILAIMARDGVTRVELEDLLGAARKQLAGGTSATSKSGCDIRPTLADLTFRD